MKVWLFCICHNESTLMPFFLRHYGTFCDKMIFYDDVSSDGTREIIKSNPKCELRDWPGSHGIADDEFLEFANTKWKEAIGQTDWVAWVDADEFLYHPKMLELLKTYMEQGVQVPRVRGFGMVANAPPFGDGQIYDYIRTGFPSPEWGKQEIFRADLLNMGWTVGRHSVQLQTCPEHPSDKYKMSDQPDIALLHYRYLGREYMHRRCTTNYEHQPERCRRLNYGANHFPGATMPYSLHWYEGIADHRFPEVIEPPVPETVQFYGLCPVCGCGMSGTMPENATCTNTNCIGRRKQHGSLVGCWKCSGPLELKGTSTICTNQECELYMKEQ